MKMRALVIGFFMLKISTGVNGQNRDSIAVRNFYEQNTILWPGQNKYIKSNQSYPLKNLANEFSFSKEASWEFKQYKQSRTVALITAIAGNALIISSTLTRDRGTRIGLLGSSLVPLTISLTFSIKATPHLQRAIWIHNRDVLIR